MFYCEGPIFLFSTHIVTVRCHKRLDKRRCSIHSYAGGGVVSVRTNNTMHWLSCVPWVELHTTHASLLCFCLFSGIITNKLDSGESQDIFICQGILKTRKGFYFIESIWLSGWASMKGWSWQRLSYSLMMTGNSDMSTLNLWALNTFEKKLLFPLLSILKDKGSISYLWH